LSLTLFLAFRHFASPRRSRAITLTVLVAMGGIFTGVLALTVILSVMNGMERELAGLIHDGEAHIELRPLSVEGITGLGSLLPRIEEFPGVAGAAPFVRSEVLCVRRRAGDRSRLETAVLTGVDPPREGRVTEVLALSHPPFQDFAPRPDWVLPDGGEGDEGLLLGVELARNLGVGVGERVELVVPDASSLATTRLDSLRGRQAWRVVVGLVDAGLYESNATRAYGRLATSAEFLQVEGEAQGIGVRCHAPARAPALAGSLLALPALAGFEAETWQDRNRVLFDAMAREKALMYLFLLLTVGVASLGIVGAMTLMISEKRAEIGILRTLGMGRRGIMGLVVLEGWLVGLFGVGAGLAGGWGLGVYLQSRPLRIPWDLFVLETVPILLNPVDFIWVGSLTLAVCLLATLYPGWEAARMDPIAAIRSS